MAEYVLDPIPFFQLENWLRRNQESHQGFNQALGLTNTDLTALDPTNESEVAAWVNEEYQQLYSAYAALGIS